jgi:hypothetical protein
MCLGSRARLMCRVDNLMSRLLKRCGILNISQPYRPPRPVMWVALLLSLERTSLLRYLTIAFLGHHTSGFAVCVPHNSFSRGSVCRYFALVGIKSETRRHLVRTVPEDDNKHIGACQPVQRLQTSAVVFVLWNALWELFQCVAGTCSEFVVPASPSRAVIRKGGWMGGLSGESVLTDGNCQMFPLNFQCVPGNSPGFF